MNQNVTLPAPVSKAIERAKNPFTKIAQKTGNLVSWEREGMYAMQLLRRNTLLQKCDPVSIRDAVINVATVGLSLDPALQHGALIPRYDRKAGGYLCHFDPMYRGLIKLATDGGSVVMVQAAAVYDDEVREGNFTITMGTSPSIIHNPIQPFDSAEEKKERIHERELYGCYCIAHVPGSPVPHVTWMPRSEIDRIAERSEAFNPRKADRKPSGPWVSDFQEMAIKTVIKRAQKQWPKGSGRLEKAVELANIAEGYDTQPQTVEAEVYESVSGDEAKELRDAARAAKLKVEKIYSFYNIKKMEELRKDKLDECRKRINEARVFGLLKTATSDTALYAEDLGVTFDELEKKGAEVKTKAKLFSKRK